MAFKNRSESPTKLTEFAPLSSDSRPSGSFFSRLFKRSNEPADERNTASSQSQFYSSEPTFDKTASNANSQKSVGQEEGSEEQDDSSSTKSDSDVSSNIPSTISQTRTLSSVLKRLSNILDRRSTTPQAYKDSDFKQYWMPDDNCKECYECGDKFNTFRRRHHCRICGQIFCSRCCNQEVPGKIMGYTGYLRVCTYCCKVVLSYAQNYAQNPETSGDLRALSEELKHLASIDSEGHQVAASDLWTPTSRRKHIFDEEHMKRSSSPDITSPGSGRNPFDLTPQNEYSSFDSFQHERKLLTQDSAQLRELWLMMLHPVDGIETQSHRHRLRTYVNCFVGSEVVDWLLARDKVANREQAVAIGQAMVDAKWLESVTPNENVFRDEYSLYKPGESAPNVEDGLANSSTLNDVSIMVDEEAEPAWFREIKASSTEGTHPASGSVPNDSPSDTQRSNSIFYVETSENNLEAQKRAKRLKSVPSTGSGNQDSSPLPHQDSSIFGMQGITDELFKKEEFVMSSDSVESNLNEGTNIWQQSLDHLREDNGERQAFEILRKTHKEHLTALTNQLLSKAGLSLKWAETIMQVVHKISLVVRPDVRHEGDDMDLRQYVQIKKLAGTSRSNTSIICGVVCSKNVTHKKMRQTIANPKILLLRAPLVYQRVENKMSSLEPQILQEYEFLRHCVGRIAALKPDVLLVEKAVSRVAQDFILDAGITLVINVKPSVMQRVSRFTQADIVTSIDGLVNKTTLGFCHSFKMVTFNMAEGRQKSLMYFDGCASHLGCTVILRGGSTAELAKVKTILHFMTYVAYHSKLEISFLMDEFAMPPADSGENMLDLGVQSPVSESGTFPEGVEQAFQKEREREIQKEKESEKEKVGKEKVGKEKEETAMEGLNDKLQGKSDGKVVENKNVETRKEEDMDVSGNAVELRKKDSNVLKEVNENVKNQSEKTKIEKTKHSDAASNRSSKPDESLKKQPKRSISREGKGGTTINDFSDPLQSYQKNKDESIFSVETKQSLKEEKPANVFKFKATLQDLVLSCSPYISLDVPYLEAEVGSICNLRKYFSRHIYWSEYFDDQAKPRERTSSTSLQPEGSLPDLRYNEEDDSKKQENETFLGLNMLPAHKFVKTKITAPVTDSRNQALLADFRATGGRIWVLGGKEAKNEESKRVETLQKGNLNLAFKGIDCLDPYYHQRIAVLFSSFSYDSANSPNPCVNPWVVSMDFYGRNDIPLGGFLERYCFRENYLCPSESCDIPMVDHIRRFVHENGCITIISKKLDAPLRGHPNNTIYMWQWCRKCKEVTGVTAASIDTWSMSFAKYLELRFHGNMYTRRACQGNCSHSLHLDHFQYFGYNQIVASFKYSNIQLREVTLPPIVIEIDEQVLPLTILVDGAKMLSFKGTAVYSTIMEHLHRLKRDAQTSAQVGLLNDYITEVQNNKEIFRTKIDEVQTWLASIAARSCEKNENDLEQILVEVPELYALTDGLSMVKSIIAEAVYMWNGRIVECDQQQRKYEKMKSQNQKEQNQRQSRDITDSPMPVDTPSNPTTTTSSVTKDSDDLDTNTKAINEVISEEQDEMEDTDKNSEMSTNDLDKESSTELDNFSSLGSGSIDATTAPSGANGQQTVQIRHPPDTGTALEQNIAPLKPLDTDSGSLCQGSPDVLLHRRSRSSGDGKKFSKQISLVHEHSPTDAEKTTEKNLNRASMKNILSSLLSSSDTNPVTMPFSAEEHHLLPPGDRIPVIVLDQEPSSIIAYTLSSPEYEIQLQELKNMLQPPRESQNSSPMVKRVKKMDAIGSSDSLDVESDDFSYFGPGDPLDTGSTKSSKSKVQPATNYHIELQFSDNMAKFYCRVYFAEQFQKLRKLIFPEGEDRYIRSLSNCFNWLARGGKSGSTFCKTQDDRFILKQMSRLEVQSFVEFAPGYFQYVTKAFNEQTPTVLAKILGVYRIGYRNSHTGRELKQDLLVMENLFYKRKITQIFDLKGSMRNRLVNTSGKRIEDLVLLDENLLKSSLDNPMYIRPHSKAVLTMAITNDTSFLSSHLVMDYSLLVGLDEANKELVVGIIDYIRTFTWDKKLEMVVKSTYSQLGGQGKMPTVVSPELYRSRFLEAMDRYFLSVPDRWTGLGRNVDY